MSLNVTINQVLKPKYHFTGNIVHLTFKCIIKFFLVTMSETP